MTEEDTVRCYVHGPSIHHFVSFVSLSDRDLAADRRMSSETSETIDDHGG